MESVGRLRSLGPGRSDLLAGLTVALVLIPQSIAYAKLAGLPPERGLWAAGIPLLVAAPLASSPYLATGPVALTALLTFGALSVHATPGSDEYVMLGLLLAAIVGVVRLAIGALRAGVIAYLMSQPMLMGFVPAAALLIVATQVPSLVGVSPPDHGIVGEAVWSATNPGSWDLAAIAFAALVAGAVVGGRRLRGPLFPGVLVGLVAVGAASAAIDWGGPVVGSVDAGLPPLSLDLPWSEVWSIAISGIVIALVGFAEPAAIARSLAASDRAAWDPDREFRSQGAANVAAAVAGGMPVGGSFGRSALNRMAGARSRWSGAVAGLLALAVLPVAFLFEPLPRAALAAVILVAVIPLIQVAPLVALARASKPQFLVAATTFGLTIALAPRIEWAVVAGVGLAIGVHLWRELRIDLRTWTEGPVLHLRPEGVLWFGAAQDLETRALALLAEHHDVDRLVLHLDGAGRLDLSAALALRALRDEAGRWGVDFEVLGVREVDRRLVGGVVQAASEPPR